MISTWGGDWGYHHWRKHLCFKAVFGFLGCLGMPKKLFLRTEQKTIKKPTPSVESTNLGNFGMVKLNFTHLKVVETFLGGFFLVRSFDLKKRMSRDGWMRIDQWVGYKPKIEKKPVTFNVLGSVNKTEFLMDTSKDETGPPRMNPFTDIVAYTNTLQGLPLATIQNHEVRMCPSPVSSDFAWLHIGSDPNDYDKYARAAYIVISDSTALKPRPASAGVFVDDPDCLHMSHLKDPNSVFRDAIHDQLDALTRSGFVKNHDYKKIFKRSWYERERRKHAVALGEAKNGRLQYVRVAFLAQFQCTCLS